MAQKMATFILKVAQLRYTRRRNPIGVGYSLLLLIIEERFIRFVGYLAFD
jgi:hypothetical protein